MRSWALLLISLSNIGCTGFVPVRSATVTPGIRGDLAATVSMPPGDEAAWFWSLDCVSDCDRWIPSLSAAASYGFVQEEGAAYELGVGASGLYPYLHGFVQLRRGPRPVGVGGRIGLPHDSWREDVLYVAYDVTEEDSGRIVMTTSLFRHGGGTPNGATRGSLVGLGQGLGLVGGAVDVSLALVVGRVQRESEGRDLSSSTAFLVLGMGTAVSR